jgi:rod shape-determining protein MreC
MLFILLEALSLRMISKTQSYQQVKTYNAANNISGRWYTFTSNVYEYFHLKYENEKLNAENAKLRGQLKTSYTYDHDSLLPHSNDSVSYEYTPARIIDNMFNKSTNYFTLNKGKNDGIEKEMGVLTGSGIFGIITNVSDNYSLAMSVVSTKSMISVKHTRSGAFGNLVWDGIDPFSLQIENISKTVSVKKNDTFVTTGFSSFFPPDIPVAVVKKSKQIPTSGFLDIHVLLTNNMDRITNVYIVKHERKQELDTLRNTIQNLTE